MIDEFTKAYNEGRSINDERYDELVKLYSVMLSRTEDEMNALSPIAPEDIQPIIDQILNDCKDALANFKRKAADIPDDWMQSRIDEINRKFDALVSQARSDLIDKGLYNSTIWPTTQSGIERDRQFALTDLADSLVTVKLDAYGKVASLTAEIGGKIIDVVAHYGDLIKNFSLLTDKRNEVYLEMLKFMERRDDDYPGLDQLSGIAAQLGYGESATMGGVS